MSGKRTASSRKRSAQQAVDNIACSLSVHSEDDESEELSSVKPRKKQRKAVHEAAEEKEEEDAEQKDSGEQQTATAAAAHESNAEEQEEEDGEEQKEDGEAPEADDSSVVFDGFRDSAGAAAASSSSSSSSSLSAFEPGRGNTVMKMYSPKAVKRQQHPPDTNFLNPNAVLQWGSIEKAWNIHYSQMVDCHTFLRVRTNEKDNRTFHSLITRKSQKFDFAGNGHPTAVPHEEFVMLSPFGVVNKFSYMWPHGNAEHKDNPRIKFPPKSPADMRFNLILSSRPYCDSLSMEQDGLLVDPDFNHFANEFCRSIFEKTVAALSWDNKDKVFPDHSTKINAVHLENMKDAQAEYKSEKADWDRAKLVKGSTPTKPPVNPATLASAKHRATFLSSSDFRYRAMSSKDAAEPATFNLTAPVLATAPKAPKDAPQPLKRSKPVSDYAPLDAFFRDQYENPPPYVCTDKSIKPGYPRVRCDLPMYRCITMEERQKQVRGSVIHNQMPFELIPVRDRFLTENDVVAVLFTLKHYDSQARSGWRYCMKGVIWLGEKAAMNENRVADPSLDPLSYFLLAQPYERNEHNFRPHRVEDGNVPVAAAAAAAASSEQEPDDEHAAFSH